MTVLTHAPGIRRAQVVVLLLLTAPYRVPAVSAR